MPSNDPNSQKRAAMRDPSCSVDHEFLPPRQGPAGRPAVKCDPLPPLLPVPVFLPPTGAPNVEDPPNPLPPPLSFSNEELSAVCSDYPSLGPIGPPFLLPAGSITALVYFEHIPNINDAQLLFIQNLPDIVRQGFQNATVPQIALQARLTIPQATFLKDAIDAAILSVENNAEEAAAQGIDCWWENVEQTATCGVDALDPPAPEGYVIVNPSVVPAGEYRSKVSQEDADAIALSAAENGLRCLWGNDEITQTCEDIGYDDPVPNDEESPSPDEAPRVGTVTIPANTFFSTNSKAEANALAVDAARGQLNCYYVNEELEFDCETTLGRVGVWPEPDGDFVNRVPGDTIVVPVGTVVSKVSTADANAIATAIAISLLLCQWKNEEVTVECPSVVLHEGSPDEVTIPPSDDSPVGEVTIPAGTVVSQTSQAEADENAELMAMAQLNCLYCNLEIEPVCVPEELGPFPIPIPIEEVDSTWSINATLGVAEGTFCSSDAAASQQIADSVGSIPASVQTAGVGCLYENDEVEAECDNQDGLSPEAYPQAGDKVTLAAGVIQVLDLSVPVDWNPTDPLHERAKSYANYLAQLQVDSMRNCFYDNSAYTAECEDLPVTGPGAIGTFTVPAALFRSYTSKDEADDFAEVFGESQLFCYYMAEKKATCANGTTGGFPGSILEAEAIGYGSTQSEADGNALALATSLLNCIYGNTPQSSDPCPGGTLEIQSGTAAANMVGASSVGAADVLAKSLANGMRVCIDPDAIPSGNDGQPGNDGAQTDCDGLCYGYYS